MGRGFYSVPLPPGMSLERFETEWADILAQTRQSADIVGSSEPRVSVDDMTAIEREIDSLLDEDIVDRSADRVPGTGADDLGAADGAGSSQIATDSET